MTVEIEYEINSDMYFCRTYENDIQVEFAGHPKGNSICGITYESMVKDMGDMTEIGWQLIIDKVMPFGIIKRYRQI